MSPQRTGRYVRIEGSDGTGKSTQIELAKHYSQQHGLDAVFVREPGATAFGNELRSLLLTNTKHHLSPEVELALFTADRLHTCNEIILPALTQGKTVISDRGVESTVCYQSAGGGIDTQKIMDVSRLLLPEWYMQPDELAILAISRSLRRQRLADRAGIAALDKIESRDDSYSDRVHAAYETLFELPHATVIDASANPETVFETLKPLLFGESVIRAIHQSRRS